MTSSRALICNISETDLFRSKIKIFRAGNYGSMPNYPNKVFNLKTIPANIDKYLLFLGNIKIKTTIDVLRVLNSSTI
jgi:hypothetical protein